MNEIDLNGGDGGGSEIKKTVVLKWVGVNYEGGMMPCKIWLKGGGGGIRHVLLKGKVGG